MSTPEIAVGPDSSSPAGAGPKLFARNATGLVRGVTPKSAWIMNIIPGHPVQTLAASFFLVFSLFPGGSWWLGLLMVMPLALAMSYAFGLLTQMMPRSGGDYMLVSRVIHPLVGLVSSCCMTLAGLLSNAFFGIAFATIGLGPGLVGLGLVSGDHTLVSWGNTVATDKTWEFALGVAMMAFSSIVLAGGWRWTLRFQNAMFWLVTLSLLMSVVAMILTSHQAFVSSFNSFARPYTHEANTYAAVIATAQKSGVNTSPGFSLSNTIPIIGAFATFSIFNYWTTFVGGELRGAATMRTSNTMAGAAMGCLIVVMLCALLFLHSFGQPFMIAANGGGFPKQIATTPTFFFLAGASTGSVIFTAIVAFCYLLFWPLNCYISMIQPTRMMFAWAFDGLLPKGVTKLSRKGAPWVAIVIVFIASALTFLWAINASSFVQVIVYATLVQLIAMGLVGLSGMLVPWRRPELFRASSATKRVFGIPVVSIAGAGAVFTTVFIWYVYFNWSTQFGLSKIGNMLLIFGVTAAIGVGVYLGAKWLRGRQGIDIDLAYAEIPPE